MAPPIVYRWDDVNAPVARGERRSLCDILYACLVTGYGTKPAAGWTREYVNATFDKASFSNNPATGTGFYLQVDGAGATYAYQPKLMGYEVMTSESAGLFPFVASAITRDMWTSNAANTIARPWVLVADDRAFYLIVWTDITTAPTTSNVGKAEMFFGDPVAWNPSDAYNCSLVTSSFSSNGGNYGLSSPSVVAGSLYFPRNIAGVATPITAALIRGGGPGSDQVPGGHGIAYTSGDPILISRPHINNASAYTFRGFLPGFYYPCHPNVFGQLATVTADGKNYLSIRGYVAGQIGNYFIALDDWRL